MVYFHITVSRSIPWEKSWKSMLGKEWNPFSPSHVPPTRAHTDIHRPTPSLHPSPHFSISPPSRSQSLPPHSFLLPFLQQTWPRSRTARQCRYRTTSGRCARAVPDWAHRAAATLCWTAAGRSALSSCFSRTGPPTCGWPPTTTCGRTTAGSRSRSSSWSYHLWWCRCWASAGSRMTTRSRTAPVPPRQPWWRRPEHRGVSAPRRVAPGPAAAEPAPGSSTASYTSSS